MLSKDVLSLSSTKINLKLFPGGVKTTGLPFTSSVSDGLVQEKTKKLLT